MVSNAALNPTSAWQEEFLVLLPQIKQHSEQAFYLLDPESKEEAVQEVVANCLVAYRRLWERGELRRVFAAALVRYAVRQYYAGRRVGTSLNSRDLFAARSKRKAGYRRVSIESTNRHSWCEALVDTLRTPVPDQVQFRIDFADWLSQQPLRSQHIAERLSIGYQAGEVAVEFKISPSRLSQLRRAMAESWQEYTAA